MTHLLTRALWTRCPVLPTCIWPRRTSLCISGRPTISTSFGWRRRYIFNVTSYCSVVILGRPLAESATVSRSASLRPAVQMTAPPQLSHEEIHSQPSLSPAGTLSAYSRATSISRTSSSRPTTTPPPQVSHEMANTQPQSSLPHQAPQPKYSSATLVSRNPSPHPSVTPVRRVSHEEKSQQPDTSSKGLQSNDSDDFYKHSSDGPRRRGSSQTTWSEGLGDSGRSINIQVTQHASQPISAPVPTRPSQDGAPPPFMTTSAPPATPPPPVPHSRKSMTQWKALRALSNLRTLYKLRYDVHMMTNSLRKCFRLLHIDPVQDIAPLATKTPAFAKSSLWANAFAWCMLLKFEASLI